MKKFRVKQNDTVRATAVNPENRVRMAGLYDSGFTKISEIQSALLRKIAYCNAKSLDISITNEDEQTHKSYTIKVNK